MTGNELQVDNKFSLQNEKHVIVTMVHTEASEWNCIKRFVDDKRTFGEQQVPHFPARVDLTCMFRAVQIISSVSQLRRW